MPLGICFLSDFGGFWKENGAKLGPRWHQKSIPTSKDDFLKKHCFSQGKTMILKVLGIEVGSQKPSNIDQKTHGKYDKKKKAS